MQRYFPFLGLVLAFVVGIFLTYKYYGLTENKSSESSTVLLERIQNVCKLVTVEGHFSEVYQHSDYWGYNVWPFNKKILIIVKAKVSAGYDMTTMKIVMDSKTKTVILENVPKHAQVLSIDHTLEYFDINEGSFNSFTPKDYSELNEKAKNFIKTKAEESQLRKLAEEQGNKMLDMIRFMAEASGWKVEEQVLEKK
jgi:hypothetical protein